VEGQDEARKALLRPFPPCEGRAGQSTRRLRSRLRQKPSLLHRWHLVTLSAAMAPSHGTQQGKTFESCL